MCLLGIAGWMRIGGTMIWILYFLSALSAGLTLAGTLSICLSQARGAYLQTGLVPLATAFGLFVGVVFAVSLKTVWPALAGQLAGAYFGVRYAGHQLTIRWRVGFGVLRVDDMAQLASVAGKGFFVLLGTAAFTLFPAIDAFLCSKIGPGSISIMSYAQRVLVAASTAISLGSYAIAARTYHDAYLAGGVASVRRGLGIDVLRTLALGILAWLAYDLVGYRVLALLFSETGAMKTQLTVLDACLRTMLLGMGPMAAMPILFRFFYTLDAHKIPACLGLMVPGLYGGIGLIASRDAGVAGLALAYVIAWCLVFAAAVGLVAIHKEGVRGS